MRRPALSAVLAATAAAALAAGVALAAPASAARPSDARTPAGAEIAVMHARGTAGIFGSGSTPISYHSPAPVMDAGVKTYVIWYGTWAGYPTADRTLITDFLRNVGGSPYWAINTSYTDTNGAVTSAVSFDGEVSTTAYLGTKLTDSNIKTIVNDATTKGFGGTTLPVDADAVYFVLTSKGISETSGFLTKYCGWHTFADLSGKRLKYSFVGDPTGSKLTNCANQTTSPNGNAGVDAMISVIAHELEEAATDPELNAWYDSSGYENADKCAWKFGTTWTASNGSKYNITLGTTQYLIQQNWALTATQGCSMG